MALYVSAARRRRRTIVVGAVALVAGLLLGWLIGRATGSSAGDEVKARQDDAEQLGGQKHGRRVTERGLDPARHDGHSGAGRGYASRIIRVPLPVAPGPYHVRYRVET